MLAFQDPNSWLPPKASTFTGDVDGVFVLNFWLCVFFFVLITGVLFYAVVKWRRRTPDQKAASDVTHNTTLEVVWTVIPLVIMMVLFAWGWKGSMDMTIAPADALQYRVTGKQWNWQVWHPDATTPYHEMYVPIHRPVKVELYSDDVLHAFYVPAFRCKRDVLPGRQQMVWFEATRLGTFPIMCAEYCGRNHSYMQSQVHVVTEEEFAKKPWDTVPADPVEYGREIWERRRGCKQCHSIDGSKVVGPSFKGLWGKTETLADGSTVVVDQDYVAESIRLPQAKIVKGFEGQNMSNYADITSAEIDAIVAFLKSLQ